MEAAEAARNWREAGPLRNTPDPGLINGTWLVGDGPDAVLQWLNPIFAPSVNRDIAAITTHLRARGIDAPHVLPTHGGALWVDEPGGGCWRMLSYIPGRTIHRVSTPELAHAAGSFVGRFHRALADYDGPRHAPVRRIHDTPTRMAELESALHAADGHPLASPARDLGAQILADWAAFSGPLDLPERTCHGDLKISNFRFAEGDSCQAVALIDLDTLGPMSLSCELGDAWRSWCNPAGEDDPAACRFSVELFAASLEGWWDTGPRPDGIERDSLLDGPERICLELAARFCTDAVTNSYFREDRAQHPQPGAHNLLRARCQHALARSAHEARPACAQVLAACVAEARTH